MTIWLICRVMKVNIFRKCRYIFHTRSICKTQMDFYQKNDRQFGKKVQTTPLFFLMAFFLCISLPSYFLGGWLSYMSWVFCLQGSGIFVPRIIDLKHSNQLHLLVVEPTHLKNPSDPFCSRSFGVGLVLGAVLHLRLIGGYDRSTWPWRRYRTPRTGPARLVFPRIFSGLLFTKGPCLEDHPS